MIKKNLIKKLAVLSMAIVMSLSMVACGDDDKENTEKEITTEAVKDDTEATTESTSEEATEDDNADTDEPASTEAYVEENGKLTVKHVTIDIPEEFSFYQNMNGTIAYATETRDKSFAFYAEDDNRYDADQVVDAYVAQVQNVYGSQVTDEKKTYNGHEFTVMDIDDPSGQFVGQAAVLCEDSTVIYIEYVSTTGDESQFDTMMNTITF
ncbi:MAG: hypothetical protein NC393_04520 [Clostridium sp.]|nr:hypothetical protein [Clostridium sp.]MCM1171375.1 hypothetical protein [Clostridium sp.]MCM1207740.1 hypothetical protein [Ruminococcus sp.]